MKRISSSLIILGLIASAPVSAGQYDDYEYARVLLVEPVAHTRFAQPDYDCRYRPPARQQAAVERYAPAVVGAVAGGIIGNHLGGKKDRPLTTVLGSVVGASLGGMIAAQQQLGPPPADWMRCQPQSGYALARDTGQDTGYEITYYFGDRKYVTRTDAAPGPWVKVRRDGSLYEDAS